MNVRVATASDLPDVLRMLLDDRATPSDETGVDAECYLRAFQEMQASDWNRTWVADLDGRVAGTFQLTFIRNLMRRGSLVAQIESVRVDAPLRGRGIGLAMMRFAIEEARRRGCSRLQLTSNKSRIDAHRFYERLGFTGSHLGMKLALR